MKRVVTPPLFPTLLTASMAAHFVLPFIALPDLAPDVALEPRRPTIPMAVHFVPPSPTSVAPSLAEAVLAASSGRRRVAALEVAPTRFEPADASAPVLERQSPARPSPEVVSATSAPATLDPAPRDVPVPVPKVRARERPTRTDPSPAGVPVRLPDEAPGARTIEASAGVEVHAEPIAGRNRAPEYPSRARLRRLEGTCSLLVEVNAQGEVESVRVDQSSGHEILDAAAVAAVRGWRFRPARTALGAMADTVRVPITFRLHN